MRYDIKVERLTPVTFNQWTDGGKVVIDTMSAWIDVPENQVLYVTAETVGVAKAMIRDFPYPVGTFFVIANIGDFLKLVECYPDRDLRLLVV